MGIPALPRTDLHGTLRPLHPMTNKTPRVAGFTFVRNALLYDYPVLEAIRSILPVCDYFVVAVGRSEDATLDLVYSLNDPRLHIIETVWDETLRTGGRVLAEETNKAFDAIPPEYDWCFYIQADECVHEDDLPTIQAAMQRWQHDPQTEGLLFRYRHFYGSYDYIGASRRWYRREVRIVRNDRRIRSWGDAQGFRLGSRKLRVRLLDAWIYHYGWVKPPDAQQRKQRHFHRWWHPDAVAQQRAGDAAVYTYDGTEPLERFEGTHPAVMLPRIQAINWHFDADPTRVRWSWKDRLSRWIEQRTGWRPGEYRNYYLLSH